MLPTQKQFKTIARDVKKLADTILQGEPTEEEVSDENLVPKTTEPESEISKENTEIDGNIQPIATSSPIQQSMAEFRQSEAVDSLPSTEQTEIEVTVGFALITETQVNEKSLFSNSPNLLKQVICEVPSELRKLAKPSVSAQINRNSSRIQQKKRGKKCAKTRMTRGRVSNLHIKVKHMLSNLISNGGAFVDFQDASDMDIYESEILQRNISYGSFHSLREENLLENLEPLKIDASVECEIKMNTKDTATITVIEYQDSSIQVNDALAVELQMIDMPESVRKFLDRLKSSASDTKFLCNSSIFNMKIYKHWHFDSKFREGLTIISNIFTSNDADDVSRQTNFESYEDFVNALNCLYVLENLFKPHKILVCIFRFT